MHSDFFARLDVLVREAEFRLDRPRGTEHPRNPGAVYPVDYGHLAGTTGGDGDGVDVFRGTADAGVVAAALTADLVKRDVEVKVLVGCTDQEVAAVEQFLSTVLKIGGLVVPRTDRQVR
jgi:inorganic pyrophosphatase